jgi:hypothetical protein
LDFPQPFGPTTPTSWPGSMKLVGSGKDLKPESLIELSRTESLDRVGWTGLQAGCLAAPGGALR